MSLFDPLKEAVDRAKDSLKVDAQDVFINMLNTQILIAERECSKLESENTELLRENRDLQKKNAALNAELAALENKAITVDVGPCLVKLYKDGQQMNGAYCLKCSEPLNKDVYGHGSEYSYYCRRCTTLIPALEIDSALKTYAQRNEGEKTL